jgi:flavin-dependent dehydrogenase
MMERMQPLRPLPLSEIAGPSWDAIVVGAGVAGSVAAYSLASAGLSVLLVDKASFPRWKVCGACLNPASLATLGHIGLGELTERCGAVPVRHLHLAVLSRHADIALPGWKVLSRERFDAALTQAACDAGATFLPGTAAFLAAAEEDTRTVMLRREGDEATTRARLIIAADGLGSRFLAGGNGRDSTPMPGSRIGAGVVVQEAPDAYQPGIIYMAYGPYGTNVSHRTLQSNGYIGLARREDGRLNIAAAFDVDWLRASHSPGAAATQLLNEVGWPPIPNLADFPWRGTPPLTRQADRPAAERLLAIGDAAGYVEPFTGEGIGWALASGTAVVRFAVAAIEKWQPSVADGWVAWHRRTAARRQRLCRAIAWLSRHPRLAHAAVGILGRFPWLATPCVRYLSRTARTLRSAVAAAPVRVAHARDHVLR